MNCKNCKNYNNCGILTRATKEHDYKYTIEEIEKRLPVLCGEFEELTPIKYDFRV